MRNPGGWLMIACIAACPLGAAAADTRPEPPPSLALRIDPVAVDWQRFEAAESAPSTVEPLAFGANRRRKPPRPKPAAPAAAPSSRARPVLGAARARTMLRSLTLPGWGQVTAGRPTAAKVFGIAEVGIWASFTSFRIQEQMRRQTYERTAHLLAGIDLRGRDEEFRRIVGSYLSSDEYNQLVVYRDAANLYYDDPAAYRAYIAAHSLSGKDTWSWDAESSLLRYRGQRKNTQRAALRANTALGLAIVNRLVSAVHAARGASHGTAAHSWNLEAVPAGGDDATAFRFGVNARF